MNVCRNCNPGEACFVPDEYLVYGVDEFGKVSGEENMMQEIQQRGPIACGISVPEALEEYTSGIYCDKTGDLEIVHDISVVDTVRRTERSTGWLETPGESTGVRMVSSESAEELTTSPSSLIAPGPLQRIPGPRRNGIRPLMLRRTI